MGSEKLATRRRYGAELKRQILAECNEPGASVAKIAMSHGVNANVVHNWRKIERLGRLPAPTAMGEFVPMTIAAAAPAVIVGDIRIELRRGTTTINVTWPGQCGVECAAWIREILR